MERKGEDKEMRMMLQKKVDYFFKNQLPIHVNLKNKKFLNGYILEVSSDFFILNEFKDGNVPVFFVEIYNNEIEVFREENKE